jgi:hypothetical protein
MKTPLDLSSVVIPAPDVLVQELDGEAVFLNLDSERYFGLDDVGTRIWQLLVEHRRVGRICEEMHKEYEVDEAQLRADVFKLLDELIDAGIVSVDGVAARKKGDGKHGEDAPV